MQIPIILHTAAAGEVPGLSPYYDAVIAKPSTFEDQLRVIRTLLSNKPRSH